MALDHACLAHTKKASNLQVGKNDTIKQRPHLNYILIWFILDCWAWDWALWLNVWHERGLLRHRVWQTPSTAQNVYKVSWITLGLHNTKGHSDKTGHHTHMAFTTSCLEAALVKCVFVRHIPVSHTFISVIKKEIINNFYKQRGLLATIVASYKQRKAKAE